MGEGTDHIFDDGDDFRYFTMRLIDGFGDSSETLLFRTCSHRRSGTTHSVQHEAKLKVAKTHCQLYNRIPSW